MDDDYKQQKQKLINIFRQQRQVQQEQSWSLLNQSQQQQQQQFRSYGTSTGTYPIPPQHHQQQQQQQQHQNQVVVYEGGENNNNTVVAPFAVTDFRYNHMYAQNHQQYYDYQNQPQQHQHQVIEQTQLQYYNETNGTPPLNATSSSDTTTASTDGNGTTASINTSTTISRIVEQQPSVVISKLKFLVLGAAGAGKTSILRRYYYNQFEWDRFVPTLGSDFYTTKVQYNHNTTTTTRTTTENNNNNILSSSTKHQPYLITVQMWDTPGRERFNSNNNNHHNNNPKNYNHSSFFGINTRTGASNSYYNNTNYYSSTTTATTTTASSSSQPSSLSTSFFNHADAILLVYDMTSSTSFKQILKWYADLMELYSSNNNDEVRPLPPPILICANKLDLYNERITKALKLQQVVDDDDNNDDGGGGVDGNDTKNAHEKNNNNKKKKKKKDRRHVIFGNKQQPFRGQDFRYEYQVCPIVAGNNNNCEVNTTTTPKKERRIEYISSYLANRETNWTNDNSYLDSLYDTEENIHPDKEMVLLWCKRNSLVHVEVSAATGYGITETIETLIRMSLDAKIKTTTAAAAATIQTSINTRNNNNHDHGNEILTQQVHEEQQSLMDGSEQNDSSNIVTAPAVRTITTGIPKSNNDGTAIRNGTTTSPIRRIRNDSLDLHKRYPSSSSSSGYYYYDDDRYDESTCCYYCCCSFKRLSKYWNEIVRWYRRSIIL